MGVFMKRFYLLAALTLLVPLMATGANDPHSIGRNVKYLDYMLGTGVLISAPGATGPVCNPATVRCVTLNASGNGPIVAANVATLEIAADSTRSTVCLPTQAQISYTLKNFTADGVQRKSQLLLTHRIRVESAALNDLSLIDRFTGQPFNGALNRTLPSFSDQDYLSGLQSINRVINLGSDCTRGFLSRNALMQDYGLSESVARQILTQPLKLILSVGGQASGVQQAQLYFGARGYSD
jgi:hypothetical protein